MPANRQRRRRTRLTLREGYIADSGVMIEEVTRMGVKGMAQAKNAAMHSSADRKQASVMESRRHAAALRDLPDSDDFPMAMGVLTGDVRMDTSHAGNEFDDIFGDVAAVPSSHKRKADHRPRRERTQRRTEGFEAQIAEAVVAFMEWSKSVGVGGMGQDTFAWDEAPHDGEYDITVLDMWSSERIRIQTLTSDQYILISLVRQGLLPCAPFSPSVAFTTRAVELFRVAHLRSPALSAQAYVKSLCDIHGVVYQSRLAEQFRICYDLLLRLRAEVDRQVKAALGRDDPDWRLKNTCPACTYRLEGEEPLSPKMLAAADGNNSLKRIPIREKVDYLGDEPVRAGESKERLDSRDGGGSYYLRREEVDQWTKEIVDKWRVDNLKEVQSVEERVECEARWKNMAQDFAEKMWRCFEESGVFITLCRHGFVLLVADMICSGELSKYPLSMLKRLLDVFEDGFAMGYDIGCQFAGTVKNSPLGEQAERQGFRSLVGLFHGHAHNRLCQVKNLLTYLRGLGLEDLEVCERLFSRTNALAAATRHMSSFHRRQEIATYLQHLDIFDTYQNLSKFLVNNYRQAQELLTTEPEVLEGMRSFGLSSFEGFEQWLQEECEYLEKLEKEPPVETLGMEYYQALVNLDNAESVLDKGFEVVTPEAQADMNYGSDQRAVAKQETQRRHAWERRLVYLHQVQDLEMRLQIKNRWTPESPEWEEAGIMVANRRFRRCVDHLEGLLVSRLLEMKKLNMNGTGYNARQHISKALQARSKAVRTALENYNKLAALVNPPAPSLTWNQVVNCAFLADFDFLKDVREDIRSRSWTSEAGRALMDKAFKLRNAKDEITRLHVEIQRHITYMHDERQFLRKCEVQLSLSNPLLAHQIYLYRMARGRADNIHMKRYTKLRHYQGNLQPGVALSPMDGHTKSSKSVEQPPTDSHVDSTDDEGVEDLWASCGIPDDSGDEGVDDEDMAAIAEFMEAALRICSDD